jgi:hypothetical protein
MKSRTLKMVSATDIGASTLISIVNMGYTFTPANKGFEVVISKSLTQKGVTLDKTGTKITFPKGKYTVLVTADEEMEQYSVRDWTVANSALLLKDWNTEAEALVENLQKVIEKYGEGCETDKLMTAIANHGDDLKNLATAAFLKGKKYFEGIDLGVLAQELGSLVPEDEKKDDTEE